VIDALDEYDDEDGRDRENDIREILNLFIQLKDLDNIRLRIFITSRPEIRNSIVVPTAILRDVALHNAEVCFCRYVGNKLAAQEYIIAL
jgi:hypothetical protein